MTEELKDEEDYSSWSIERLVKSSMINSFYFTEPEINLMMMELETRKIPLTEINKIKMKLENNIQADSMNKTNLYNSQETEKKIKLENSIKSGSIWFFFIGGSSIVNTLLIYNHSTINFIVGLGITQIIDAFINVSNKGQSSFLLTIGLFINFILSGLFILFGYVARQRKQWAFILGIVLYSLDSIVFIYAKYYPGIAFHALSLFFLFKSFKAIKELNILESGIMQKNKMDIENS